MNQQVKAGLNAVRDFLAGRSGEAKLDDADDQATREVVAAELLAAMCGRNADGARRENSPENSPMTSAVETQEIPRFEANDMSFEPQNEETAQQPGTALAAELAAVDLSERSKEQEQERARKLFLDHGYFDEAVEKLGSATSAAERAAAARALGLFGSQRGTPHLIAAMFDDDADVRSAAEEALAQIADPIVSQSSVVAELSETPEGTGEPMPQSAIEVSESLSVKPVTEVIDRTVGQGEDIAAIATVGGSEVIDEESQMVREEQSIRETVELLEKQLLETITAINESENEVQWRIERETQLRADAEGKRREEEATRQRAVEAAETRRIQEREAVAAEQAARARAESEAVRHAEEQTALRLKAARLRVASKDLARRRAEMETARLDEELVAREAEASRARDEAKAQHEAALNRFQSEEAALRTATNELALQQANIAAAREKAVAEAKRLKEEQAAVEEAQRAEAGRLRLEAETRNREAAAQLQQQLEQLHLAGEELETRRAEAEAARAKADAEAERLVDAQARMKLAEEARAQTETERAKLEVELNQQKENQLRLLEETRRRGEEEQASLKEELRRQTEAGEQRLTELEAMRARAEAQSKERLEQEQQILSQVDSLRIADAETRRRIADAEVRRRAAEDAFRVVAEKVQRVEAEAHARAKEEERIIAKLEAERRTVAVEAQSRAEQEQRIREEIEMFRRLEEQERPRIEEATLQLATAEARMQERKDRLKDDEEARISIEDELDVVGEYPQPLLRHEAIVSEVEAVTEAVVRPVVPKGDDTPTGVAATHVVDEAFVIRDEAAGADEVGGSIVTPAIATYLNSVDPYKRAAAVAELARSGGPDAFNQIVECFDDYSPHVRNAAARALRKLEPKHTVDLFNRSLEGASANRRRNIGGAIAASGLAAEAIDNLDSENREDTYNALSILFVMAKTGEIYPLVQAIEGHESVQVRMAAIKLLTLTGQADIANSAAKRRLETNPREVDYLG